MSSWGVDWVAALVIGRGESLPLASRGFLPGGDEALVSKEVWDTPVEDVTDVVDMERRRRGGAASLPEASTSKLRTWLRAVTGGSGGGDLTPRLLDFESEPGRRAGDAEGDRRGLGDAACGDRGGARAASGSATACAMRKEIRRLSSGFLGFLRGGGVFVRMAAFWAAVAPPAASGRVYDQFPAVPRPPRSRGLRLVCIPSGARTCPNSGFGATRLLFCSAGRLSVRVHVCGVAAHLYLVYLTS